MLEDLASKCQGVCLAVFLAADRVDGPGNSEHYIGYIPINLYTEAVPPGVEARTVMGGLVVQASD